MCYLFGVVGAGAGAFCAGADFAGAEEVLPSTDRLRRPAREAYTDSVIDVSIKTIAAQVVALLNTVAAVRVPKAVWLPMPPKAAAMSALLPLCSSTTVMRNAQTITWMMVISMSQRM